MKYLLPLLIAVLMLPIVSANIFNSCDISPYPIIGIERKIPVVCDLNTTEDLDCVIITYANGTLLSTSPEPSKIIGIGIVDSFKAEKGLMHGYYSQFMLMSNRSYDVKVICGDESYNRSVVPILKGIIEGQGMIFWFKDNAIVIIACVLFVVIIVGILIKIFR